jgi:hypothetical protein
MKKPPQGGIATARHMTIIQTVLLAAGSMLGAVMMLPQHDCAAQGSEGN